MTDSLKVILSEDQLDELAELVASRLARRFAAGTAGRLDRWLDTRDAASYLGIHRDTLRKLAAQGRIPFEQEGRGCKLFFRQTVLDVHRSTLP